MITEDRYYELELKDTSEQMDQDLRNLQEVINKIVRAKNTEEICENIIKANKYLSNISRDKKYIIELKKKEDYENN